MKHIIEGDEVLNYLEFLYYSDKLEQVLPVMEVPEHLVVPFITYKAEQMIGTVSEQEAEIESTEDPKVTSTNKGTNWSETEVVELASLIYDNVHINTIAKKLDRSPSAVRNKAYYGLNYRFVNNKWSSKGDK